jgi:hypothetical protein
MHVGCGFIHAAQQGRGVSPSIGRMVGDLEAAEIAWGRRNQSQRGYVYAVYDAWGNLDWDV